MADISGNNVSSLFRSRIRDVLNSGISWGTNRYPNYSVSGDSGAQQDIFNLYKSYFGGSTSGRTDSPSASLFSGDVNADQVRSTIVEYASRFTAIRRVDVHVRYQYNEAERYGGGYSMRGNNSGGTRTGDTKYRTVANETKIGHLNDDYLRSVSDPGGNAVRAGYPTSLSNLSSFMDDVRKNVEAIRNDTVNISRTYCHTNCHTNCHSSCHGDGPGSDIKLKTDLHPLGSVLDKVKVLQTCTHLWNDWAKSLQGEHRFDNERHYSFIAQDIQHHFPELVYEHPDGYLAIRYQKIPVILTAALQELTILVLEDRSRLDRIERVLKL